MKKSIKLTSAVLTVIFVLSMFTVCAGAIPAPMQTGDVNVDYTVDITDASCIQRYLAKLNTLTKLQIRLADTDGDSYVTIRDATVIQMRLAKLIGKFGTDDYFFDYVQIVSLYPDFDSGKAMTGTPVTFTAEGVGFNEEDSKYIEYEFYVNDVLCQPRSKSSTFTHTFDTEGFYNISVVCYTSLDNTSEHIYWGYEVVQPYTSDTPILVGFTQKYYGLNIYQSSVLVANAAFGDGDYYYSFSVDGEVKQDFSVNNEFRYIDYVTDKYDVHDVTVTLADKNGNVYDSITLNDLDLGELLVA